MLEKTSNIARISLVHENYLNNKHNLDISDSKKVLTFFDEILPVEKRKGRQGIWVFLADKNNVCFAISEVPGIPNRSGEKQVNEFCKHINQILLLSNASCYTLCISTGTLIKVIYNYPQAKSAALQIENFAKMLGVKRHLVITINATGKRSDDNIEVWV